MEKWQVHANGGLRARSKPVSGAVKYIIPDGKVIDIYHKKVIKTKTWGQLAAQKAKDGKLIEGPWVALWFARRWYPRPKSPVPGHGIGTPYGRKKKGLWGTKGYHTGDDYPCNKGTPVVAVTDGTIVRAWDNVLGNIVLLYSTNGDTYWYCHLSRFARGSGRVHRGEVIGYAGDTGTGARGYHLHFERHNGHSRSWWAKDMKPTW